MGGTPPSVNLVVVCTTLCMQLTLSTIFYFQIFRAKYSRLAHGRQQPVPAPVPAQLVSVMAMLAMLFMVQFLALRFEITSVQEALKLAGCLWVIDTSLNIRHYIFEHRPLALFLIHVVYTGFVLCMVCVLLAVFGTRP